MIVFVFIYVLATGEVWTNPIVVGLVVGLPTSAFGLLAYRRAEKLDEAAARAAMVAAEGDAVQRVIDGLDTLVSNLRVDKEEARQEYQEKVAELRERLADCTAAYAELKRLAADGGP